MFDLIQEGRVVKRRLFLRRARVTILLLIIPVLLFFNTGSHPFFNYILAFAGLFIFFIEFQRPRKTFRTSNASRFDWFLMSMTNLFIFGGIIVTGGAKSVLLVLLLVPLITFTVEFGLQIGVWHLIAQGIFLILTITLTGPYTILTWLHPVILFLVSSFVLFTFRIEIKGEARITNKIARILTEDELTGLYNRRFLKTKIKGEIKKQAPFVLIIMDLNYFKHYNDRWGHAQGDQLLIQIGRIIKASVAETDKPVRYSGDEFIVFCPGTYPEKVAQIVAEINQRLSETYFPGEECFPDHKLTFSFGSVRYPDEATNYDSLLETADRALYQNKRNR